MRYNYSTSEHMTRLAEILESGSMKWCLRLRGNKNFHKLLVGIKTDITTFRNNWQKPNEVQSSRTQWLRNPTSGHVLHRK